ncbi:mechanosensitive ion channel family protein [Halegenticoccus tardaugens]|uniref:mechanosensitive ion channel family protein n=1 Tax=Halegenticoccus tardaugens TaxID=2071624 RepID=UPI00100AFB3D|nr:hypothetical protein [Halegenticoccus tardaugens]
MLAQKTASGLVLQGGVPEFLQSTISNIIAFLPRLIGALVILIIGWIIGRVLGGAVRSLTDRAGLDRRLRDTPLGRLGGSDDAMSRGLGKITAYYIYLLAILAAANALAVPLLSQWVSTAVSYLPAFVAGLLVIIFGFVLADFVADVISRTEAVTNDRMTAIFADGVRFFLYFAVLVIGLDTMGVQVQILYLFARALAFGLAIGLALAIGIAFGLGGRDYVSQNMDQWAGRARSATGQSQTSGTQSDD